MSKNNSEGDKGSDFESIARREKKRGGVGEVFAMVVAHRKWFLIPILIALLLVGVLVVLGGTAAAPFLYPLF